MVGAMVGAPASHPPLRIAFQSSMAPGRPWVLERLSLSRMSTVSRSVPNSSEVASMTAVVLAWSSRYAFSWSNTVEYREGPSVSANSAARKASGPGDAAMKGSKYLLRKSTSACGGRPGGSWFGGVLPAGRTGTTIVTARTTLSAGTTLASSVLSAVASG